MNNSLENWDKKRESNWQEYISNRHSISQKELTAFKVYYFEGDLMQLLDTHPTIGLDSIVQLSPAIDSSQLKRTICEYWFWMLEDPQHRGPYETYPDLNDRFNLLQRDLFHPYLHSGAAIDTFKWIYGVEFLPLKPLKLEFKGDKALVDIVPNIHEMEVDFLRGFIHFFWRENPDHSAFTAYDNRKYFFDFYRYLDNICFETDIPRRPRVITPDGKKFRKANITYNHWFVACLNGYVTKFEKEEGIQKLSCYKTEEFDGFIAEFTNSVKHPLFDKLQDYIMSHNKNEYLTW